MNTADLPEDLQGMSRGVLMNVLCIDPWPTRPTGELVAWPEHMSLDPFDPEQADAWLAAVKKHEAGR